MVEQLEEVQSVIFWARGKGLCHTYEDIKRIKDGTITVLDLFYSSSTIEYSKTGQKLPKVKRVKAVFA